MRVKHLSDEISARIKELFGTQLIHPIELIYIINNSQRESFAEASQLFGELADLSDKITFSLIEIEQHPQLAKKYNVDQTPVLVVCARENEQTIDYGIRFLGTPSGYEFSSLIQAIGLVSKRDSGLKTETRKELKGLQVPLRLKVFVTPT